MLAELNDLEGTWTDGRASRRASGQRMDLSGPFEMYLFLFLNTQHLFPTSSDQHLDHLLETFFFLTLYHPGETVNQSTCPP